MDYKKIKMLVAINAVMEFVTGTRRWLKISNLIDNYRTGGRPPTPHRHYHRSMAKVPHDGRWHMKHHRDRR